MRRQTRIDWIGRCTLPQFDVFFFCLWEEGGEWGSFHCPEVELSAEYNLKKNTTKSLGLDTTVNFEKVHKMLRETSLQNRLA
jgi:hypothetical protein